MASIDRLTQPTDDGDRFDDLVATCERCTCCETEWVECEQCGGEGVFGHDCGEDTCCCLNPEDDAPCSMCDGEGGWDVCLGKCDDGGNHVN